MAAVQNGTYKARLTAIRRFRNPYGDLTGFEFTLVDADVDGVTVMRFSPPDLSPESELADLLRALLGRDIEQEEMSAGVDLGQLIGAEYNVLVGQCTARNGQPYNVIERILR